MKRREGGCDVGVDGVCDVSDVGLDGGCGVGDVGVDGGCGVGVNVDLSDAVIGVEDLVDTLIEDLVAIAHNTPTRQKQKVRMGMNNLCVCVSCVSCVSCVCRCRVCRVCVVCVVCVSCV